MRREVRFGMLLVAGMLGSLTLHAAIEPIAPLAMSSRHPQISRVVTDLIERYHYSHQQLDDSVSSAILDEYLDILDSNRVYFLASDVGTFGRYRYELDDRARAGTLDPAFEIFNRFRDRVTERLSFALTMLETEPDFTIDEDYRWDRTELGWPNSQAEMEEIWRLRVKNDALTLVMADPEQPWAEVAKTLRERYERIHRDISDLDDDDAFEYFMNAVARTMDPHSSYLSAQDSEEYRIDMSNTYEGIGARLREELDFVTVEEVITGGPAHLDGKLQAEDRITAVAEGDGEFVDVIGMRLDDVVRRIRGPGGSVIRLQVLPRGAEPGSPQTIITLTRDKVKLEEEAAKSEIREVTLDDGSLFKIGVINVPKFYQDFAARTSGEMDYTSTSRDVTELLLDLEAQGVHGVVMDLRQNGGGHLSEAIELSGLFIDSGPVVQVRETTGALEEHDDPSDGAVYDGPLAVLVDRYSASASEIFAAAIQDYERGVIIGQQTFGKGTVQNLFDLDRSLRSGEPGNGQLTLTIGKYYRVTGDSTQNRGVFPDIELPSSIPTEAVGENTRPTALPWDRIASANRFNPEASLETAIDELNASHLSRSVSDPNYNFLVEDASARTRGWNENTVSLNIEKRRAEQEQEEQDALSRENSRRAALGLPILSTIEELQELENPVSAAGILLDEATRTVAEIAARQRGPSARTSAAGANPAVPDGV